MKVSPTNITAGLFLGAGLIIIALNLLGALTI